jgi:hypothetical protein
MGEMDMLFSTARPRPSGPVSNTTLKWALAQEGARIHGHSFLDCSTSSFHQQHAFFSSNESLPTAPHFSSLLRPSSHLPSFPHALFLATASPPDSNPVPDAVAAAPHAPATQGNSGPPCPAATMGPKMATWPKAVASTPVLSTMASLPPSRPSSASRCRF